MFLKELDPVEYNHKAPILFLSAPHSDNQLVPSWPLGWNLGQFPRIPQELLALKTNNPNQPNDRINYSPV